MLLFKKKFLDAIRSGKKTQTIRLWNAPRFKAGQLSYINHIGPIRIKSVDEIRLADLTDTDARPDGFATADLLRAEIAKLYDAKQLQERRAYRVVFRLVKERKAQTARKVTAAAKKPSAMRRRKRAARNA